MRPGPEGFPDTGVETARVERCPRMIGPGVGPGYFTGFGTHCWFIFDILVTRSTPSWVPISRISMGIRSLPCPV